MRRRCWWMVVLVQSKWLEAFIFEFTSTQLCGWTILSFKKGNFMVVISINGNVASVTQARFFSAYLTIKCLSFLFHSVDVKRTTEKSYYELVLRLYFDEHYSQILAQLWRILICFSEYYNSLKSDNKWYFFRAQIFYCGFSVLSVIHDVYGFLSVT